MPHKVFSGIYLHVVWHTKGNEHLITSDIQKLIKLIVLRKCSQTREVMLLEIGGIENHVHLALKVPPTLNIAKFIGQLKGMSSYEIKRSSPCTHFAWQVGYGIVSFSEKDRWAIVKYIRNQKEHHDKNKLLSDLEKIE